MVGTVNSFLGMSCCALHNQSGQRWSGDTAIECSCGTSVRTQALDVDIAAPYSPQYFQIDRLAPQAQTPLVTLNYIPNTIASLQIPDTDERLLATGGQDSELHLSIHSRRTSSPRNSSNTASPCPTRRLWQYDNVLSGSINNSVLLTSLSLTRSNESSAEPRVAISNNDCTVKFFDVNVCGAKGVDGPPKRINEVGTLQLDVPVNHCTPFFA
jgi:hypothetical protein